mgnify:CR=1 FL=1
MSRWRCWFRSPVCSISSSCRSPELAKASVIVGRVSSPRLPAGPVRVGGFGGVAGLVDWITKHDVDAVVDATHPFAGTMGSHAAQACSQADVPLLRLARPGWTDHPDAGDWTWVDGHDAAREAADALGGTPFVTTGRQTLHHHVAAWADREVVVGGGAPGGDGRGPAARAPLFVRRAAAGAFGAGEVTIAVSAMSV